MRLSVFERLNILSILPTEGSFTNLRIVRLLRESLSFSESENKSLDFVPTTDNRITWNIEAAKQLENKEIKIGEVAFNMIKRKLKELDEKEKLSQEHYSLYVKFNLNGDENKAD